MPFIYGPEGHISEMNLIFFICYEIDSTPRAQQTNRLSWIVINTHMGFMGHMHVLFKKQKPLQDITMYHADK